MDQILVEEEQQTPYQREMEIRQIAAALLLSVWSGIDHEYLSKYRMEIWRQFEERVATCSRITNSLTYFLSRLSSMMQVAEIGASNADRLFVSGLLKGRYGNPDEILAALRRDPQVCVMLMRIQKDEAKSYATNK
jgi:hypothetical protein